ncbi:MAG: hypothetical protein EOS04_13015 [Mesorhizobium sp.]|nr:MAG: hypothetical protein EOR98_13965 [Mesorhizobium sp.]RWN75902.1 MAG: hypothetical protein EOS02_15550 [Mesorhizobium sp.]RWN79652.1 MAG: hypothetical protein EOS01_13325 [Mesorhizobium sp.]RWN88403.1 MAG: hypothetical protein EOS04_13015 [Mesorhizobium sp.]RWO14261.1 MAG: hypothetical protein EOS15_15065 [Mesorhizobium sp.]
MASGRSPAPPISICSRAQFLQNVSVFWSLRGIPKCLAGSSFLSLILSAPATSPPAETQPCASAGSHKRKPPRFPEGGLWRGTRLALPDATTSNQRQVISVAVHTCCTIADECGRFPATPKAFTCNAIAASCRDRAIDWHFIAPGKPIQKAIESFNGDLRNCQEAHDPPRL